MRTKSLVLIGALVGLALSVVSPASASALEDWGYLEVRDGTRLRYHVAYPAEPEGARFPVLLRIDPYEAGTTTASGGVDVYIDELIRRGYAVAGVSMRGTGCSAGAFDPFERLHAQDAYDVVEWMGSTDRPWSDGRVGMIGVSAGGITQLLAAGERPPSLKAIVPWAPLADFYRDVTFPGGILNTVFPTAWVPIQKSGGTLGLGSRALPVGDTECFGNYAAHEVANTDLVLPKMLLGSPYADDPFANGESFYARSPLHGLPRIDVPAYLFGSWQDEQLPSRWFEFLGSFADQEHLWVNVTNGFHGRSIDSPEEVESMLDFLDRFVAEIPNGFEDSVPRVRVGMETSYVSMQPPYPPSAPSWTIDLPLDASPVARTFSLDGDGGLSDGAPSGTTTASYAYPMPSGDVLEVGNPAPLAQTGRLTWKGPLPPGGALAYTTEPLAEDLVALGPASLDLWLSSTATDTDVQVTVTEVRPDGMETYVQRGWLRASHRRLDPALSTPTRPYHTHARADAEPLTPGAPTLMRVEVFPFAHAFRAGSRLRVWIDAPTGRTGLWGFAFHPEPAVNTVYTGAEYPSKLVVGVVPGEVARAPLPPCDSLVNQPCRPDVHTQVDGRL